MRLWLVLVQIFGISDEVSWIYFLRWCLSTILVEFEYPFILPIFFFLQLDIVLDNEYVVFKTVVEAIF